MHVKASLPSYKRIEVNVDPKSTVTELKRALCKKLEIEPELTRLLIRGKPLPEKAHLSKLGDLDSIVVDYLWARHLPVWGSEGQRKIRSATILLAGAGAIGNEVGKNLAMLGVGRLLIVDRDNVELSNVSRMIFFEPSDLSVNKAEALAGNLHEKYKHTETLAYRGDLEKMPLKFLLDSNVVVCGLDNVVSRIYLTQACRKYGIPLIDGGITGMNLRVHSYIPPDDPCPICMFPPTQYSQIVGLHNPCDPPPDQPAVPSFATSIALVSSILSHEAIKIILGRDRHLKNGKWPDETGEPLRAILFIDLKHNRYTTIEMKKNPKCYVCGSEGIAKGAVQRHELPLSRIRQSRSNLTKIIRATVKGEGSLVVFSETLYGEALLNGAREMTRLQKGDYLRVLIEAGNGEFTESIIKLT